MQTHSRGATVAVFTIAGKYGALSAWHDRKIVKESAGKAKEMERILVLNIES